jgi:hypothetical protein
MAVGDLPPRSGGRMSADQGAKALTLDQKPVVIAGSSGQLTALACQYHPWWRV